MNNYIITYEIDYTRLIMGVNNDSTAIIPALADQYGSVILAYNLAKIALIVPGVSVYRVETSNGNLAAFFALQTIPGQVGIVFQQLRPAFVQFQAEISQIIANFIQSGNFAFDIIS